MGSVVHTRLRQLVSGAGHDAISLAKHTGLRKDSINKRLRAETAMQDAEANMFAMVIRVPADRIIEAHRQDFADRHGGKPFRGWREWTPEDDAALKAARERSERPAAIAKLLDRTESGIRGRMAKLGLTSQRKEHVLEPPKPVDSSIPPGYLVSEARIAALYAGRTYGGDTSKPGTVNPTFMPHRPMAISACGSTAQMCVEFAR